MRSILLALLLLAPLSAFALTTSERALRIEDRSEGNVLLGAESAVIEKGEIYNTVVLLWGRLEVKGELEELVVLSGHVVFHEGSRARKSVVVMGGTFESLPGAQVTAESVVMKVPGPAWRILRSAGNLWREHFDWVARLLAGLLFSLLTWLSAWGLFHAFPGLQGRTEGRLGREWGMNLFAGVFGAIVACALSVLLVISIVGILLVPFYLLLLLFAGSVSYMAATLWAGHRMLPPKEGKRLNPLGLLLGVLAFQFLWNVPLWWASLPVLLLWTLSWGALVRNLRLLWK